VHGAVRVGVDLDGLVFAANVFPDGIAPAVVDAAGVLGDARNPDAPVLVELGCVLVRRECVRRIDREFRAVKPDWVCLRILGSTLVCQLLQAYRRLPRSCF
jgi:hypothetical protein